MAFRACFVVLALLAHGASAFFAGSPVRLSPPTSAVFGKLQMSVAPSADIKAAEAEAMAASKKFGKASKEAVAAWDAYEELAASDNSITSRPGLDENCDTEDLAICEEYAAQMTELEEILAGGPAADTMTVAQLAAQNKRLIEENSRLRGGK